MRFDELVELIAILSFGGMTIAVVIFLLIIYG